MQTNWSKYLLPRTSLIVGPGTGDFDPTNDFMDESQLGGAGSTPINGGGGMITGGGSTGFGWKDFLKFIAPAAVATTATGLGVNNVMESQANEASRERLRTMSPTQSGYSTFDPGTTTVPDPGVTEIGGQSLSDSMQSAEQRYLTEILKNIDTREQRTNMSYADLYRQLETNKARRGGLSDATGFTGGMQQQLQTKRSAAEQAAFLQAGTQRTMALGELGAERQAAESNAKLMAQQEFDMIFSRIDRISSQANNYYTLAAQARQEGRTDEAEKFEQAGNSYMTAASQIASQAGLPTPEMGGAGGPGPSAQTIDVPTLNVNTDITGSIGLTQTGKEAISTLATNLTNLAESGTDDYFGYDSRSIYYQAKLLDKLPVKISSSEKSSDITIGPLDNELAEAIAFYEAETGETILRSANPRTPKQGLVSKADARRMIAYYINVHQSISAIQP